MEQPNGSASDLFSGPSDVCMNLQADQTSGVADMCGLRWSEEHFTTYLMSFQTSCCSVVVLYSERHREAKAVRRVPGSPPARKRLHAQTPKHDAENF